MSCIPVSRALGKRMGISCCAKEEPLIRTNKIHLSKVCQQGSLRILNMDTAWNWEFFPHKLLGSMCIGFKEDMPFLKHFVGWGDWDLKGPAHPQALGGPDLHCVRRFVPRTTFPPWVFLLLLNHGSVLKLNLCCAYVASFLGGWNNKATGLEIRFPPLCC